MRIRTLGARECAHLLQLSLLCAVHAKTSTGLLHDIPPLREVADECTALLLYRLGDGSR